MGQLSHGIPPEEIRSQTHPRGDVSHRHVGDGIKAGRKPLVSPAVTTMTCVHVAGPWADLRPENSSKNG